MFNDIISVAAAVFAFVPHKKTCNMCGGNIHKVSQLYNKYILWVSQKQAPFLYYVTRSKYRLLRYTGCL